MRIDKKYAKFIGVLGIILTIQVVLLTPSCAPIKHVPIEQKDSVRVEILVKEKIVTDTIILHIPKEVEVNRTKDSVSFLENSYSESTAKIEEGLLYHDLKSKQVEIKEEIQYVIKDSLVYKDREVIKEVVIEVEKELSRWDKFLLKFGVYALGACLVPIIYLIYLLYKKFTL